jgi:hypothetical protein
MEPVTANQIIHERGRTRRVPIGVALLTCLLGAQGAFSQQLSERSFRVRASGETVLSIAACAPGTSWEERGREAVTLTLFVDGRYSQDIVLFGGAEVLNYTVMLGRLNRGLHRLRVEQNSRLSVKSGGARIRGIRIATVTATSPAFQALASAPILYARPNTIGRFSDVPLLMYCETIRDGDSRTVRYSVIFSNEDGGTRTAALMARWGRTTDIEWMYEIERNHRGEVLGERFQGVNHKTRAFTGRREGSHPLLIVASDNNNFDDQGESAMRFAPAPIVFDGRSHSREEMMDRNPWTYRVMAEELKREGKLISQSPPASAVGEPAITEDRIDDPRRYLYIEASCRQRGTALAFEVKLRGESAWYSSDLGQARLRIDRSGYFRTAIRLPSRITDDEVDQVTAGCSRARSNDTVDSLAPECVLTGVSKVFLLDESFRPGRSLISLRREVRLEPGKRFHLIRKRSRRSSR